MNGYEQCTVPDCDAEAEYDAPGHWCEFHWAQWWNWHDPETQPAWMPEIDEEES